MSEKKKSRNSTGRRSRGNSLSPTHDPQTAASLQHLESQLKEKDERIAELEARLQSQEELLAYRLSCMERLQKERDDLRKTNASLIGKTAELSRKQSINSYGSPSIRKVSRSATVRQALPPTPESPKPPVPLAKPSPPIAKPSPPHRSSRMSIGSQDSDLAFVIPPTVDSDDSDMEDEALARANYINSQLSHSAGANSRAVVEVNPTQALPVNTTVVQNTASANGSAVHGRVSVSGSSVPQGAAKQSPTVQSSSQVKPAPNGRVRSNSEEHRSLVQDSAIQLPKSTGRSGSGAIAQLVKKHIIEKRHTEKMLTLNSKESGAVSNGPASPDTKPPSPPKSVDSQLSMTSTVSTVSAAPSEPPITDLESSLDASLSPTRSISAKKPRVRWSGLDFDKDDEEEGESQPPRSMRARTNTLAAIHAIGKKPVERGRRMLKELKKDDKKGKSTIKRQSSLTNLNRKLENDDLELISPELAAWVRNKFIRDLENKYGGHDQANKAAISIQRAYREYKLRSRFKLIQRNKHLRTRAQSMRTPGRRPSILKKNQPLKYRREQSIPDTRDPVLKAREAAKMLNRERFGHSHSGARLDLVEQKRRESKNKVVEFVQEPVLDETLELEPPSDSTPVVVNIEGACEGETSTDPKPSTDKPDGLTPAYSTSDLPRPVSIFSTGSSISAKLDEAPEFRSVPASKTLPRQFKTRHFSIDTINQKKSIGVNHFNRKPTRGIQYLVMSDILEDDPRGVADFLMNQYGLSKTKIGEFLGEINSEFNMAVLECLVEQMDMGNKPIDEALRQFQTIFRMPGEAQKIDKIMEVFALEYFKANKESALIRSEDAAYMLSFAIMMLHTSLHNPSVRSRITKKQWVTMNRGCNEGENFSQSMLVDVYDRILTREFTTGADHTDEVIKIEKQISGLTIPKLADPQRRLLCRYVVREVVDPNSRSYRAHWRTLFVFSDLVILCKNKGRNEFSYKDSFSLFNMFPIIFDTHHHKHGIQVFSSMEHKVLLQCACESSHDRDQLLEILEKAIAELKVMETERIAELGTTLAAKPGQDKIIHGGSVKHTYRISRGPSDLEGDSYEESGEHSDFVLGVGDIAVNTGTTYARRRDSHLINKENRSSGDSGFDSQQPTPSPSPTEPTRYTPSESPSPSHPTYLTPDPSLISSPTHTTAPHTTHLTPDPSPTSSRSATPSHVTSASPTHLTPDTALTTPPRSKSSDAIRSLTVIPSTESTHHRSPSADLYQETKEKSTASPKKAKKGNPKRDSSKKKSGGLFSSFGMKMKAPLSPKRRGSAETPSSRRGSYTPPSGRVSKHGSLEVPSTQIETRGRSSSSVDLTQTT